MLIIGRKSLKLKGGALLGALWILLGAGLDQSTACDMKMFINDKSLVLLAEAPNLQTLQKRWADLPYQDLTQRAIYYSRLLELQPSSKNEIALLRTLPSSPIDLHYYYAISDTKAFDESSRLSYLYGYYFIAAAHAAAKHPEFIKAFLVMNRFATGELGGFIRDSTELLSSENPDAYLRELRKLDRVTQESICGECPELQGKGGVK